MLDYGRNEDILVQVQPLQEKMSLFHGNEEREIELFPSIENLNSLYAKIFRRKLLSLALEFPFLNSHQQCPLPSNDVGINPNRTE